MPIKAHPKGLEPLLLEKVQQKASGDLTAHIQHVGESLQLGERSDERICAQDFMVGAGKNGVLLVSMGTVVELGAYFWPACHSIEQTREQQLLEFTPKMRQRLFF